MGVDARPDALVERLLKSAAAAFDIFATYLGDRLGFYEALAGAATLTSGELAAKTGTHERYVREWFEQQTITGILEVEDAERPALERRYRLPAGHREVLVDRESLNYLAPLAQLVAGSVAPLPQILEAYRKGGGVPYEQYGRDLVEGQSRVNRPMFLRQLDREWLPAVPGLDARLRAEPPAHIADLGCGCGWSSIGMARAYPKAFVDGFDLDVASIEMAQANARAAGLEDRVKFQVRDAGDPALAGLYDLVTAFECIHDMSNPMGALRTMRRLARDGGEVLVVDERVADRFGTTGEALENLMYGFSVLHCLPVGMAEQPSAGTGTVMRAGTLRRYALDAGFRDVEVLAIEHFQFRFYRLLR